MPPKKAKSKPQPPNAATNSGPSQSTSAVTTAPIASTSAAGASNEPLDGAEGHVVTSEEKEGDFVYRAACDLTGETGVLIFGAHLDSFSVSSHNPRSEEQASDHERRAISTHRNTLKIKWTGAADTITSLNAYEPSQPEFQMASFLGFIDDDTREPDPFSEDDCKKIRKVEKRFVQWLKGKMGELEKTPVGDTKNKKVVAPPFIPAARQGKSDDDLLALDDPPFRFKIIAGQHRFLVAGEIRTQAEQMLEDNPQNPIFANYKPNIFTKVYSWDLFKREGAVHSIAYGSNRVHHISKTNILSLFRDIEKAGVKANTKYHDKQFDLDEILKTQFAFDDDLKKKIEKYAPCLANDELRPELLHLAIYNWTFSGVIASERWLQVKRYLGKGGMWDISAEMLRAAGEFTKVVENVAREKGLLSMLSDDDAVRLDDYMTTIREPVRLKPGTYEYEPVYKSDIAEWDRACVKRFNALVAAVDKKNAPKPKGKRKKKGKQQEQQEDEEEEKPIPKKPVGKMTWQEKVANDDQKRLTLVEQMSTHLRTLLGKVEVYEGFRQCKHFQHGCYFSEEDNTMVFRPLSPYSLLRHGSVVTDITRDELIQGIHSTINGEGEEPKLLVTPGNYRGTTAQRVNVMTNDIFVEEKLKKVGFIDPGAVNDMRVWRTGVAPNVTPKPSLYRLYQLDHSMNSSIDPAYRASPLTPLPKSLLAYPFVQRLIDALKLDSNKYLVRTTLFRDVVSAGWDGRPNFIDSQFYKFTNYFGDAALVIDPSYIGSHPIKTTKALADRYIAQQNEIVAIANQHPAPAAGPISSQPQASGSSQTSKTRTNTGKGKGSGSAEGGQASAKPDKGKGKAKEDASIDHGGLTVHDFVQIEAINEDEDADQLEQEDDGETQEQFEGGVITQKDIDEECKTHQPWAKDAFRALLASGFNVELEENENENIFENVYEDLVRTLLAYDTTLKPQVAADPVKELSSFVTFTDQLLNKAKHDNISILNDPSRREEVINNNFESPTFSLLVDKGVTMKSLHNQSKSIPLMRTPNNDDLRKFFGPNYLPPPAYRTSSTVYVTESIEDEDNEAAVQSGNEEDGDVAMAGPSQSSTITPTAPPSASMETVSQIATDDPPAAPPAKSQSSTALTVEFSSLSIPNVVEKGPQSQSQSSEFQGGPPYTPGPPAGGSSGIEPLTPAPNSADPAPDVAGSDAPVDFATSLVPMDYEDDFDVPYDADFDPPVPTASSSSIPNPIESRPVSPSKRRHSVARREDSTSPPKQAHSKKVRVRSPEKDDAPPPASHQPVAKAPAPSQPSLKDAAASFLAASTSAPRPPDSATSSNDSNVRRSTRIRKPRQTPAPRKPPKPKKSKAPVILESPSSTSTAVPPPPSVKTRGQPTRAAKNQAIVESSDESSDDLSSVSGEEGEGVVPTTDPNVEMVAEED